MLLVVIFSASCDYPDILCIIHCIQSESAIMNIFISPLVQYIHDKARTKLT